MEDLSLIIKRRNEVEREISQLNSRLSEMQTELAELETAGKVIARLAGGEWPPRKQAEQEDASGGKPKDIPTMPVMIVSVLETAYRRGRKGLEPKEITQAIAEQWWPDVPGENVSAITWRMWKRGQLEKDENSSVYRVPQKDRADGVVDKHVTISPSSENPEQGREAGPGGGV